MDDVIITVPAVVENITVDLFGTNFGVRAPTKSLEKAAERHALAMIEATTADELVDAIAGYFDTKLSPTEGRRTRPSTIIRKQWDADRVTIPQLQALSERLREAERPI